MPILEEIVIDVPNYNLNLTFESSFAQYLFKDERRGDDVIWRGIVPPIENFTVRQGGSRLYFQVDSSTNNDAREYLTHYVTGLWHQQPAVQYPESVSKVISEQPGIRVPWLFRNKWHVLLSTLLSVHARVALSRAWFSCLHHFTVGELAKSDPFSLRDLTKEVTGISAGFRMRYLVETAQALILKGYTSLDDLPEKDPAVLRTVLLKIRNLGPKVVDCFLLNAMGDLTAVPVDVHVGRVASALGLVPNAIGHPQHYLCRLHVCTEADSRRTGLNLCPKAKLTYDIMKQGMIDPRYGCIRAALSSSYDKAGWLQAHLFRYGQSRSMAFPRQRRRVLARARPISAIVQSTSDWPEIKIFRHYADSRRDIEGNAQALLEELRGKGLSGRVARAFALWKACRDRGLPLLLSELQAVFGISYSDITSIQRLFPEMTVSPINHNALIELLRRELELPDEIIISARELLGRIRGKLQNPKTAVAVSVYIASNQCGRKLTQAGIARSLSLTEVTIRNGLRRIGPLSEDHLKRNVGYKPNNEPKAANRMLQSQEHGKAIEQVA